MLRVAAVVLLAAGAQAAPVDNAGRSVELPVPAGYCAIARDRPPDAQTWERMRAQQEPENRLLAWFVVCEELARWRAEPDRTLERHAMVLARTDTPAVSRREVAAAVARDFERSWGVIDAGAVRMELLETRDDAVLATMMQEIATPSGPRRLLAVITYTALDRAVVTTNFYGPDAGPEALHPVRDAALAYLASLVAAYPEPRSRLVWLLAAFAAVLAALGGGALYRLRRRGRPA